MDQSENQQNRQIVNNQHQQNNQNIQQNQFLFNQSKQPIISLPQPYPQTTYSLKIAQSTVQFLFDSFQQQLKTNKLLLNIPEYNTYKLDLLNKQFVAYFYLEGQSKSKKIDLIEDHQPASACVDNITNYHIKLENQFMENNIEKSSQFFNTKNNDQKGFGEELSLNYSLSKSQQKNVNQANSIESNNIRIQQNKDSNILSSEKSVKQFHEQSSLSQNQVNQTPSGIITKNINSSQLLPLPQDQKQQPDPQLQTELQRVKKNLYMMRRYRKKNLQQERQKMQMLAKKRTPLFFNKNSDHTYQYDGTTLQMKKSNDLSSSLVEQPKVLINKNNSLKNKNQLNKSTANQSTNQTSSFDITNNTSLLLQDTKQKLQQNNPQRKLSSQQLKKISFNNGNKRQVSHLPFIVLKQNTKIIENKKELSGSMTLRNSLNKSKMSSQNGQSAKFRSFSQIQLQKRLQKTRQKALQFTQNQSKDYDNIDILPPTLNLNNNSQSLRKQSKMMQKYLKKLTQQKSKLQKWIDQDQSKVSFNFKQLKVPHKYPIQRYYEYNYEGDRQQLYEEQITSKLSSKRHSIVSGMEFC